MRGRYYPLPTLQTLVQGKHGHSVTDRFRGGSGNANYLVEDEEDLRRRFVQSNRGMVRTRLILMYIVLRGSFYIYEFW
jgi:hypothetical protein